MNLLFLLMSVVFGGVTPISPEQFYIEPDKPAVLEFQVGKGDTNSRPEYKLYDTDEKLLKSGLSEIKENRLQVSVKVPAGFYELEFPQSQTRYGIISLPEYKSGTRDPFFAMDGALSWLVSSEQNRISLIRIAKRTGIFMLRDRLSWGEIEPQENALDFQRGRHYEVTRKSCMENGVKFLEVIHDAPNWTGRTIKYPVDLVKTAQSWEKMRQHWESAWTALEVWNEPDISFSGNVPADQYTALLKTIYWKFKQTSNTNQVVGGVLATFDSNWIKTAYQNEILDNCDIFSFHTYCRAREMESVCLKFRNWLTECQAPEKELWLTECGRPWKRGTDRPVMEQDKISAIDIAMKCIEARACAVDRYFPFVYPYYDERENNFGMLDKNLAPLRSFAGYTVLISAMANKDYCGDLKNKPEEVEKTRVFRGKTDETLVVFYQSQPKKETKIQLPARPVRACRITGEALNFSSDNIIDFSDGFAFVFYGADSTLDLNTNTPATDITQIVSQARQNDVKHKIKVPSPIILSFQGDPKFVNLNSSGYRIKSGVKELTLEVKAFNLSEQSLSFMPSWKTNDPELSGGFCSVSPITIEPKGTTTFKVVISDLTRVSDMAPLEISVNAKINSMESARLVLRFVQEVTLDNIKKAVQKMEIIDLSNLDHWKKNHPPYATFEFRKKEELESPDHWGFKTAFGNGDAWIYPIFKLQNNLDLSNYDGFLVWLKIDTDKERETIFRIFCKENMTPENETFLSSPACSVTADGKWHLAIFNWNQFQIYGKRENGILDLNKVGQLQIGGNTKGKKFDLEIGKFYLFQLKK